ncbi:MAG: lipoprotein-releasing ABC transporter permease subunit [Pseudomonadota bacterium]|nr:lipoprotein-releasing ABC transporter permease subunit [Pseudomonadota bacterium]
MKDKNISLPRYIATRYVSVNKRSQLVSFMSAISIFGIALGIAILITVLSVMNGFEREMRENVLGIVPHLTIQTEENLTADDWASIENIANEHPMVLGTAPSIETMGVVANAAGNKGVVINGIDLDLEASVSIIDNFFVSGSLAGLRESRWGLALGQTLADRLGVEVGDSVDLFSPTVSINPIMPLATFRNFKVVGVFKVGSQDLDSDFVMINIAAARSLFRLRTSHNSLRIHITDVLEADRVQPELQMNLPAGLNISSWTTQFGAIYNNIQFSRTIIGFMLWLLVGVAVFNQIVSLIMIVRDKRGDIAILRTMGATPQIIRRIFMWQGCLIGTIGILIGVFLGIIGSLQITNLAVLIENVFSIQFLSAEVYPIDFLPSEISVLDILVVVTGVFLLSLLATIYPASKAAAIQPAQALRAD